MQNTSPVNHHERPNNRPDQQEPGAGLSGGALYIFNKLPSTNLWALEQMPHLAHGDVVWAKVQTAGRGRLNRQWHTPGKRGLTFSVVLDPAKLSFDFTLLGQISALAVARALDR
jgi:BirA family transcriptional regulator, biotin operon repressor / biotin---[acetyl-CoA-carboxylase] ligase